MSHLQWEFQFLKNISKLENEQLSKIVKNKSISLLKLLSWSKDLILIISIARKILSILYKKSCTIWMTSGSNIQKWSISLNIWNCSGIKTAKDIWRYIEPQDTWRIGRISRKQSRIPKEDFLIPKYKKSWTREKNHGNLWTRSKKESFQLLKQLNIIVIHAFKLKTYGRLFTNHSTQLNIGKLVFCC